MAFFDLIRGIIFGFSSCLLASAYYTFKFNIVPFMLERDPKRSRPNPLSTEILNQILELDSLKIEDRESCDWTNAIFKWIHFEVFPLPRVHASIEAIMADMLAGLRRSQWGYFVKTTELINLELGSQPPTMQNVRVITKAAESDLGLTTVGFDFAYAGGMLAIAKVDLIGGWQVFLRIRLCELSGPLYMMFKDTDVFYGLRTMDNVKVRTQVVINGVQFRLINWFVGRFLMVDSIRKKLVFPAMKSHFLIRPDVLQEFLQSEKTI